MTNRFLNCLNLHHKSPDSNERQYGSRALKRRLDPALRSGGRYLGIGFGIWQSFRRSVSRAIRVCGLGSGVSQNFLNFHICFAKCSGMFGSISG